MFFCISKFFKIYIFIILIFISGCQQNKGSFEASLSVAEALRGDNTAGYSLVTEPREFSFPEDYGPHKDYRNEWWYYTGNVDTEEGRHFGFQVTFFRIGLSPEEIERDSAWNSRSIYMAHFALTDVEEEKFYAYDRFSRDGLSLAGARSRPFRVWLEDWYIEAEKEEGLPLRLVASQDNVSIDFTLFSKKPVVLQGNKGLSQKSSKEGNASYYYSFTRMDTKGTINIDDNIYNVKGLTWMDREWSTSALDEKQVGWDWFSLQLSDGREVMFYQMRRTDGNADPLSNGTIVEPDGSVHQLALDDVELKVLDFWQTPDSALTYPSRWSLYIPEKELVLEISPHISDQELNVAVRYWEGAVKIKGTSKDKEVYGNGYVELTGYNEQKDTSL